MFHNKLAQNQFLFDIIRWSITIALMVISLILHGLHLNSDVTDIALLGIAVFQEVLLWVISRVFFRRLVKYPIDLELLQSRWGVWVMIVVRT